MNKRAAAAAARKRKESPTTGHGTNAVAIENGGQRGRSKRTKETTRVDVSIDSPPLEGQSGQGEEEESYDTCDEISTGVEVVPTVVMDNNTSVMVQEGNRVGMIVESSGMQLLERKILELERQNKILREKVSKDHEGQAPDMIAKKKKVKDLEHLFLQRHQSLLTELRSYVASTIFPVAKFPVDSRVAKVMCMNAVAKSAVVIPKDTTDLQFANAYYKVIGSRLKHARVNCQTGARNKYMGKCWM